MALGRPHPAHVRQPLCGRHHLPHVLRPHPSPLHLPLHLHLQPLAPALLVPDLPQLVAALVVVVLVQLYLLIDAVIVVSPSPPLLLHHVLHAMVQVPLLDLLLALLAASAFAFPAAAVSLVDGDDGTKGGRGVGHQEEGCYESGELGHSHCC